MTASFAFSAVECLDDTEPVFRVDAQKRQQYESDRSALRCGASLGAFPEFWIDATKNVTHHGSGVLRMKRAGKTHVIRMLSRDCVDVLEIAR